jgi:hypothetical protein
LLTLSYTTTHTAVRRDQLFFIAFGRIWAENIKPEALVQRVRTDPHSPAQFRVDGTLHNVPEFAKAFNCSPKAKVCCSVDPTGCPSHQLFSLTLPKRNVAFSGRDPRSIRIMCTLIIYFHKRAEVILWSCATLAISWHKYRLSKSRVPQPHNTTITPLEISFLARSHFSARCVTPTDGERVTKQSNNSESLRLQ